MESSFGHINTLSELPPKIFLGNAFSNMGGHSRAYLCGLSNLFEVWHMWAKRAKCVGILPAVLRCY